MIIRGAVTRHTRKVFAAPIQRPFTRTIANTSQRWNTPLSGQPMTAAELAQRQEFPAEMLKQAEVVEEVTVESAITPVEKYREKQFVKDRSAKLGSEIETLYDPRDLVYNPLGPEDITLELLMASQTHMGHHTSLWNPANQRYIYGIRQGIHIISLETTAAYLRRAAKVVEGVAYHGGLILFVGTREGQAHAVVKASKMASGCHLFERWIPGTITNGNEILSGCRTVAVDMFDKPLSGGEEFLEKRAPLKPDLVVCLNPLENYVCLQECGLSNIPTIGIIDTDADPTWVTYPIPANDDSIRCTSLIAGILGRAAETGNQKRLEAAEKGIVTWVTPEDIRTAFKTAAGRNSKDANKKDDEGLTSDEHLLDGDGQPITRLDSVGFGGIKS